MVVDKSASDVWHILGQPHGLAKPKQAKRSDFLRQLILIFAVLLKLLRPASCLVAGKKPDVSEGRA